MLQGVVSCHLLLLNSELTLDDWPKELFFNWVEELACNKIWAWLGGGREINICFKRGTRLCLFYGFGLYVNHLTSVSCKETSFRDQRVALVLKSPRFLDCSMGSYCNRVKWLWKNQFYLYLAISTLFLYLEFLSRRVGQALLYLFESCW